MNLLHLKYAVEISETHSITKAAENLYTSQPNLSRAIRELESALGVIIFKRSSKGIEPTPQGEEFLSYARKILAQVEAVENMFRPKEEPECAFSISVPRASYISDAFTRFLLRLGSSAPHEIFYKETNSRGAVNNIIESDYRLGILRYQASYEPYFNEMLEEKGLSSRLINEFKYVLVMSAAHPLASFSEIHISDLTPYIRLAHADPYVPSLPLSTVQKNEMLDTCDRHIYVFERGSQMDILSSYPSTFMWVSPVPDRILDRFGLVQKECCENSRTYRDVLIYRRDYKLTDTDRIFIEELEKAKSSNSI